GVLGLELAVLEQPPRDIAAQDDGVEAAALEMLDSVLSTYITLARVAVLRSNVERSYALLDHAVNLGYARHWGRLMAAAEVERLKLYLSEGRVTEASASLIRLDRLAAEYP